MKSRNAFFVTALLMAYTGCEKEFTTIIEPPPGAPQNPIIGMWIWVESWVEGGRETPETEGFTRYYEFTPESTLYIYVDRLVVDSSHYRITRGRVGWVEDSVDIISIDLIRGELYPYWAARYRRDTLILDNVGLDGGEHFYVRMEIRIRRSARAG